MLAARTTRALLAAALLAGTTTTTAVAGPQPSSAPAAPHAAPALPPPGTPALGWTAAVRRLPDSLDDGRLELIDPRGRITDLGPVSTTENVDDIATDGRHVLTWHESVERPWDARTVVTVHDTVGGRRTRLVLDLVRGASVGSLVPGGVLVRDRPTGQVQLWDLDGVLRRTYPLLPGRRPSGPPVVPASGRWFLEEDGEGVAVRALDTGEVRRRVAAPAHTRACRPTGGWDGRSFSMSCALPTGVPAPRLAFRAGLDARTPTTQVSPYNGLDAWPTTPRVMGNREIDDVVRVLDGRGTLLARSTRVSGAFGSTAYLLGVSLETGEGSLGRVDLRTGRGVRLVPGSYTSARTVDAVG